MFLNAREYQTRCTCHPFHFSVFFNPIVKKNWDVRGFIRHRSRRRDAKSVTRSHRVIGYSFPTWLAAASFSAVKIFGMNQSAQPRAYLRIAGEIMMARGTFVDIGWHPLILLSRNAPSHSVNELSRETAVIILSRRNWFARNIGRRRPSRNANNRSYKPIFTPHIGSADWWYIDGKSQ